jgi:hypothetical protein
MGRLVRRQSAASAAPGSVMPAIRRAAGRLRAGRGIAVASAVAIVGVGGIGVGTQLLPGGSSSQAAVARSRAIPRPVLQDPASGAAPQGVAAAQAAGASGSDSAATQARYFGRIILPDLLIVAPQGLSQADVARLRKVAGVRNMITFDGAQITVGGRSVSAIGVDPATFRSWVPLRTASDQPFWTALNRGQFVAAASVTQRLGLKRGAKYQLWGVNARMLTFGSGARLGLNGVDLLVNEATSRQLGLVHQVAALISAPGANLTRLTKAVTAILGPTARMESLRSQQLPVTGGGSGRPTTYLQLFKDSAARYCPGLSWTVLAAIGQIESADGANEGPSTAGALGPMQFEPSTWARWGTDGFGETGPPDIMNPYDAVPSAARLLCADGAASGGQSLYNAIFDYNHADWYVHEVLGLAAEYAADYH